MSTMTLVAGVPTDSSRYRNNVGRMILLEPGDRYGAPEADRMQLRHEMEGCARADSEFFRVHERTQLQRSPHYGPEVLSD